MKKGGRCYPAARQPLKMDEVSNLYGYIMVITKVMILHITIKIPFQIKKKA